MIRVENSFPKFSPLFDVFVSQFKSVAIVFRIQLVFLDQSFISWPLDCKQLEKSAKSRAIKTLYVFEKMFIIANH